MGRIVAGMLGSCVLLASCAAWGATPAEPLAQRFPAGSIKSASDVEQALNAVRAEHQRVDALFDSEKKRCSGNFFVYACEDKATAARNRARAEILRVELEARDRQRVLDAQARDARREPAGPEKDSKARLAREAAARAQSAEREAAAARADKQRAERQSKAPENRAQYEEGLRRQETKKSEHAATVAERAADAQAFADKQTQAQKYAEEKAKAKEENERRRAERKKKRDEEAARREQAAPPK